MIAQPGRARNPIRPQFSHARAALDTSRSDSDEEAESVEEQLAKFLKIHNASPKQTIAMLERKGPSIFRYLEHHGFQLRTAPDTASPAQKLAITYYNSASNFVDLYADALFQSGSSVTVNYSTTLSFKPGYSSVYIQLVVAYYLPSLASVMRRYGQQIHNVQEITSLQQIQGLLNSFIQRGTGMIMTARAAIAECIPDVLRGYPTLNIEDFRNRNQMILGDPDAYKSPLDRSADPKFEKCRFRYVPDGERILQFVLDNPLFREKGPEQPRQQRVEQTEVRQLAVQPQVNVIKPKRSAFAVYGNRKYEEQPELPAIQCSQLRVIETVQEQSEQLDDQITCPICMVSRRGIVFGCGHFLCKECGEKINPCPMCREPITIRIQVFWS